MTTKLTSIEVHESALLTAQAQPAKDREFIAAVLAKAEARVAKPITPDIDSFVDAQVKIPILKGILSDIDYVRPDDRSRQAGDAYIAAHLEELVALLRAELTDRTKTKESFLASIGKRVSSLSIEMFAPQRDKDALLREREKAEDEAESIELNIAAAVSAIRMLEVMPSVDSFKTAVARVRSVTISSAVSCSN
jgi:Na+-transporting NADH:ubiquinone oxidoreductase subunit NqrC